MFVGMKIKIFPETNVRAYTDLVQSEGFTYRVHDDCIEVGKPKSAMEAKEDFARRLRKARRKHNYSREDLANLIGVKKNTIYNWEIAYTKPNDKHFQKLIDYLGDF